MDKKPHYACKSCGGVSHKAKACSTEGCELNGKPLDECNCDNEEHLSKAEASEKAEEEEMSK